MHERICALMLQFIMKACLFVSKSSPQVLPTSHIIKYVRTCDVIASEGKTEGVPASVC